ncbi:hypothetical protein FGIG_10001, partial [Fasciola gigantica]
AICTVCIATADAAKSLVNSKDVIKLEKEEIKQICPKVKVLKDMCEFALEKFVKFMVKHLGGFSSESICTKFNNPNGIQVQLSALTFAKLVIIAHFTLGFQKLRLCP